jgi:hypothetical protein
MEESHRELAELRDGLEDLVGDEMDTSVLGPQVDLALQPRRAHLNVPVGRSHVGVTRRPTQDAAVFVPLVDAKTTSGGRCTCPSVPQHYVLILGRPAARLCPKTAVQTHTTRRNLVFRAAFADSPPDGSTVAAVK